MLEIFPKIKLIDWTLRKVVCCDCVRLVSVVVCPGKECVFEYVKDALPNHCVRMIYSSNEYEEWPGSVYSAIHSSYEKNLVLLPDTFFEYEKGETLFEEIACSLEANMAVLGIQKCSEVEKLKSLGAVHCNYQSLRIDKFQDKPSEKIENFNAFWGFYAFQTKIAKNLYQFLIDSVKKQNPSYSKQLFYPFKAISIKKYMDLGTWENINKFREECF